MPFVHLNWKPGKRELRSFGAVFMGGFLVIGLVKYFWPFSWLLTKNEIFGLWAMGIGVVVGAIGLTGTKLALPFYWAWLSIAYVMGNIMSRVIMTLIYYLVFTPMRFLGQIIGRDRLQLKKPKGDTYWIDLPGIERSERYERQF
ncbi:MAG: hypothetical protein IPM50_06635 [Acidobacteriota bacterium]|nr:MAG: hypothetical protein IPM50_06635 [Acidobacteriota bacterium]